MIEVFVVERSFHFVRALSNLLNLWFQDLVFRIIIKIMYFFVFLLVILNFYLSCMISNQFGRYKICFTI